MKFETLGVTGITELKIQTGNPIVNLGRFRVAINGGPIPSLGGNTKGPPWKGTSSVVIPDWDAISKLSENPLTTMHKQSLLKLKATRKHVKGVDKSQEPHRIIKTLQVSPVKPRWPKV